jgi:hypothetical protein
MLGAIHIVYVYKLNLYLKDNYPSAWDKLIFNSYFGITAKNLPFYGDPFLGGNYFKELKFIFSKENLEDSKISYFKHMIRIFFLLFLFSWFVAFIYP